MTALTLLGFDGNFYAECCADGKVLDGTSDLFIRGHTTIASGTCHTQTTISVHGDMDCFGQKCYLVDNESGEAEKFVNSLYFHRRNVGIDKQ